MHTDEQLEQLDDLVAKARIALLDWSAKDTQDGGGSGYIKELAEAYAWLSSTQQPH